MKMPEQIIRECALARIAEIFGIPVGQLRLDAIFGVDLKVSFVSDFRDNELTRVTDDIRDAADRKILKKIEEELLTIHTVRDYCDHMVLCYETHPKTVSKILKLPQSS